MVRFCISVVIGTLIANVCCTDACAKAKNEEIASVKIVCRTGKDDKECGVFSVEVFQGSKRILRDEFGDNQSWKDGYELVCNHNQIQVPLTGEAISVQTNLEERAGQVNITWDADIHIEVVTNMGRKLVFEGKKGFDTDHNKPRHEFDMGQQKFSDKPKKEGKKR
jgi:hypothetical protein